VIESKNACQGGLSISPGTFFLMIMVLHSTLKMLTMKKQHHNKQNKPTGSKPLPGGRTEKDADDLVHSQQEELPTAAGEEDLDDLAHRPHKPRPDSLNESKLEDLDDLVHRYQEEDDDK
jgi:hypothetical protein